jgi:hypothetical protein
LLVVRSKLLFISSSDMKAKTQNKTIRGFLKKVLFFFLPIALLAWPADIFISHNLKKSNWHVAGEYLVWTDIYNGEIDADIAIYGSSRAWIHFNPEILEDSTNLKAYNFGMDGLNFSYQNFRHNQYLKFNKKPKYIIVSGDLFFFEKESGFYNYVQTLPYMLNNPDYIANRELFSVYNYAEYRIPLYRYMGKDAELIRTMIVALSLEGDKPYRINGHMGQELEWTDDFDKAQKNKTQMVVEVDLQIRDLFYKFLGECIENGITPIIVYSPEYAEYRDYVTNREEVISTFKAAAEKYGLVFLDYSNDEISFDKKYFYNSTHLNKEGSELFTAKFSVDFRETLMN